MLVQWRKKVCVFVVVMEITDVNVFQMKGDFVYACQIGVNTVRTKKEHDRNKMSPEENE
jgi:hypothetical protein